MLLHGSLEPSLLVCDGSSVDSSSEGGSPESSSERLSIDGSSTEGSWLSSRLPLGSLESLSSRESLLASKPESSIDGVSLSPDRESCDGSLWLSLWADDEPSNVLGGLVESEASDCDASDSESSEVESDSLLVDSESDSLVLVLSLVLALPLPADDAE